MVRLDDNSDRKMCEASKVYGFDNLLPGNCDFLLSIDGYVGVKHEYDR